MGNYLAEDLAPALPSGPNAYRDKKNRELRRRNLSNVRSRSPMTVRCGASFKRSLSPPPRRTWPRRTADVIATRPTQAPAASRRGSAAPANTAHTQAGTNRANTLTPLEAARLSSKRTR